MPMFKILQIGMIHFLNLKQILQVVVKIIINMKDIYGMKNKYYQMKIKTQLYLHGEYIDQQ